MTESKRPLDSRVVRERIFVLMSKALRIANLPILAFLALGCATPRYTTEVLSEPQGARIELDQEYVGDAPYTIVWEGNAFADGFFNGREHIVSAIPNQPGHYVQTKLFRGPRESPTGSQSGDRIPRKIFFKMDLAPPPRPPLEVEIRQAPGPEAKSH